MAKDPAFLFYSSDFLVGTMTMSMEDRGKYITLLATMHQQGRLSEETTRLLVGSVSVNLKRKFQIDDNGLWFNKRLENEIEKRRKFCESRRINGAQGGRPPKVKPKKGETTRFRVAKPTEKLDENINVNENKDNINLKSSEKKDHVLDVYERIEPLFPDLLPDTDKAYSNWIKTIDRLMRIDGLTPDDIVAITTAARQDEFWAKNFLSLTKLRTKNKDGVIYWKVFLAQFKGQMDKTYNRIKKNLEGWN